MDSAKSGVKTPSPRCGPADTTQRRSAPWLLHFQQRGGGGALRTQDLRPERVAVVDFDVHHGNGTQDIFWSDKNLYFASTHQMPLYPGTGALSETGVGNIWNAPLRPGDGGDPFKEAFRSRILPTLRNFGPDLVLISAGFDAHQDDPLAIWPAEPDFAWATSQIAEIADKHAQGRLVSMLEGATTSQPWRNR
jgi:acetoin utilization deacetylase AcuC-like enzyme